MKIPKIKYYSASYIYIYMLTCLFRDYGFPDSKVLQTSRVIIATLISLAGIPVYRSRLWM